MAGNETVVRDVMWNRVLSVGHLLRTFRIALWPPSKLLLCLAAFIVAVGLGIVLDLVFETNVCEQSFCANMIDVYRASTGTMIKHRPEVGQIQTRFGEVLSTDTYKGLFSSIGGMENLAASLRRQHGGNALLYEVSPEKSLNIVDGVREGGRGFWFGPLEAIRHFGRLVCRYWQEHPWFTALNMLIGLLAWAFFGGCVARLSALQFARDQRATIGEAMKFTCKRFHSLVASPLALFVVVGLMALVVFLPAALVMWIPHIGELIAGLFFFVTLLVGFVLSFLFLFAVSSLGLQMPAIAVEGRDAFDAISRGVNYVFSRPWRYIFYTAFSLIYLCLSFVLVRAFVYLMLKIPHAALSTFSFAEAQEAKLDRLWAEPTIYHLFRMPAGSEGTEYVGAVLIGAFIFILLGLMVSFLPSFVITSQTIIYFLLRRMVDEKDLDEVYVAEEQEVTGLDRLEKTDQTRVEPEPQVDRAEPQETEASDEPSSEDAEAEEP